MSHGILVDGFSQSKMTGKPKAILQKEEKEEREREKRRPKFTVPVSEVMGSLEEPESYFKNVNALNNAKANQTTGPKASAAQRLWGVQKTFGVKPKTDDTGGDRCILSIY